VKHQIEVLILSGVTNKTQLYTRLVTKTGLPRSTIRRIASEYKKELVRKVMVLSTSENIKRFKSEQYSFVPVESRFYWQKKTQNDLISIRCKICKKQVCYLEGLCEGNVVCNKCQIKFPKAIMK